MSHSDTTEHKHTNALIYETSPYLLQHAHNPVNWFPWNDTTLQRAKDEGKLLIISVGYSACHWCHVMEKESFEDEEVAALMNEHFICIKVDREERPDVDQVYMHAVQLLSGQGGWPLNCFALPDGRPFYGGTYFYRDQWYQLLKKIVEEHRKDPAKFEDYASRLTAGVQQNEFLLRKGENHVVSRELLDKMVGEWVKLFDTKEGGSDHAPKFPIPNNYQFLLHYAKLSGNREVLDHVALTLEKMACGGIYDQLGGGFARYSTDQLWKVPHFEKMLYDNAQLVALYSAAYRQSPNELYKSVVVQTLEFIAREMTAEEGVFYSALDADSEGEEGKFYVWKKEEVKEVVGDDFTFARELYKIDTDGFWEKGNYILLREPDKKRLARRLEITEQEIEKKEQLVRKKLLEARSQRVRPGLDDKALTSWNAMMTKGMVEAYRTFGQEKWLKSAVKNMQFILRQQRKPDGSLYHSYKSGKSTINGYLEDYAFVIDALIALYQLTFEESWLNEAKALTDYTIDHFHDTASGLFYFTSDVDPPLIARKMEIRDNVIPASNSTMANNLFLLGHYLDHQSYLQTAKQMLQRIGPEMPTYGSSFSNWGILALYNTFPFYEVAFVGKNALELRGEWNRHYLPNCIEIGATKPSKLPLLEHKWVKGQTTLYVCENKTCQLPVTTVDAALNQLK